MTDAAAATEGRLRPSTEGPGPLAGVRVQVGDHGAVEDHGCPVLARQVEQLRQLLEQVARHDVRRIGARDLDGPGEPVTALLLLRPGRTRPHGGLPDGAERFGLVAGVLNGSLLLHAIHFRPRHLVQGRQKCQA